MYHRHGIGGAGNYRKYPIPRSFQTPSLTSRDDPRSHVHLLRSFHRLFRSGIGGAGNVHCSVSDENCASKKIRDSGIHEEWVTSGAAGSPMGGTSGNSWGEPRAKRSVVMEKGVVVSDESVRSGEEEIVGMAEVLRRRLGRFLGGRRDRGGQRGTTFKVGPGYQV